MTRTRAAEVANARGPFRIVELHYVDGEAQDPAQELTRLGGAKVVLATATSAKAMEAALG